MNQYQRKKPVDIEKNFEQHKKFVSDILNSVIRTHGYIIEYQEREDLIQIGLLNLHECFRKFDETKGANIKTFAYQRLVGGFIDEFRRNSPIPRRQQKLYGQYRALVAECTKRSEVLSHSVAAESLGVTNEVMSSMLLAWEARYNIPIDSDDEAITLGNSFTDDPELITINDCSISNVKHEISKLDEREKIILDMYFCKDLSLKSIGDKLGLTEGRVSQLKNQSILKIRAQVA